jgi:hypothetical protein
VPLIVVQVPGFPLSEHAWHWPVQALLQHTPSTQKPLRHWVLPLHVWPVALFGAHAPALQYWVAGLHCASLVHVPH